jgi:hypothetical protein
MTSGSNFQWPAASGGTTGVSLTRHGPAGDTLVATPMAEQPALGGQLLPLMFVLDAVKYM